MNLKAQIRIKKINIENRVTVEQIVGDDLHASGLWMHKERLIDRENDHYRERIVNPATGKEVHFVDEPLSQHWGHGSAKKR